MAVLGASSYTFAEATWTQTLPDWIGSHVRMFRFFRGVPRLIIPDNLKSGVSRASFYDPAIDRSYGMMASHYGVGVLPARPKRPRDNRKWKMECVLLSPAFWAGGTYKFNEKTAFNLQVSGDQQKNYCVSANEFGTPSVWSNWTKADKKNSVGGVLRFQRSF